MTEHKQLVEVRTNGKPGQFAADVLANMFLNLTTFGWEMIPELRKLYTDDSLSKLGTIERAK